MLQAHWFTLLFAEQVDICWGCHHQAASWVIDESSVILCDRCVYCLLEALNNHPDISSQELAPSLFDYVRGMLPRHMASCGYCLSLCSNDATLECLLENGLLAPFIDHQYITPAHIAQIISEYWREVS